jgi:hypothetical protein
MVAQRWWCVAALCLASTLGARAYHEAHTFVLPMDASLADVGSPNLVVLGGGYGLDAGGVLSGTISVSVTMCVCILGV